MKQILSFVTLFALVYHAHADIVGLHAGAGVWKPDISGDFGVNQDITTAELALDADDANVFYIAFEHPVPVLPNIRISQTDLKAQGEASLTSDFDFDLLTFPAGTPLDSTIDLSHTDYTLYYEILDTVASVDIGATFRKFDGEGSIANADQSESISIDETAPMLYGRVQVDLPFTGMYMGGTINYVGIDGDSLQDIEARVGYMASALAVNLGIELGYRKTTLQLDDVDDLHTDISFDGSYAAVVFHF